VRTATSQYAALPVQASGTFTHVYRRPGTYSAVFTVTDGYGHQTQASVTTYVSTTVYPYTGYSYPNSGSYYGGTYPNTIGNDCSGYYDRSCYVNGQYMGPSYGAGSTYNGPGDTCYFANGQWQGNCGGTPQYTMNYQSSYGGSGTVDYSCYYDRACYARMQGRGY
jgi:hypothetical protein